jgi:hypothetical protein
MNIDALKNKVDKIEKVNERLKLVIRQQIIISGQVRHEMANMRELYAVLLHDNTEIR